jgi:hypothetical protein
MSKGAILGLSFLAIFIIGGPIAKIIGSHSPVIGIVAGVIVYFILSVLFGGRNKK